MDIWTLGISVAPEGCAAHRLKATTSYNGLCYELGVVGSRCAFLTNQRRPRREGCTVVSSWCASKRSESKQCRHVPAPHTFVAGDCDH